VLVNLLLPASAAALANAQSKPSPPGEASRNAASRASSAGGMAAIRPRFFNKDKTAVRLDNECRAQARKAGEDGHCAVGRTDSRPAVIRLRRCRFSLTAA